MFVKGAPGDSMMMNSKQIWLCWYQLKLLESNVLFYHQQMTSLPLGLKSVTMNPDPSQSMPPGLDMKTADDSKIEKSNPN